MNKYLFPLINKYKLTKINYNKHPWGWQSQKMIKKIIINSDKTKYQPNGFNKNINEKLKINEVDFLKGTKMGYKTIFKSFKNKINFLESKYMTPELSLAVNYINDINKNKEKEIKVDVDNLQCSILTSWIEVGQANTNKNILGKLDLDLVEKEVISSSVADFWDVYVGPLKQKVKVLYKTNKRYDVWEWEKCLMKNYDDWTVSNINDILIE
tara:strand:- start:469 stop:1101 length:633 start_codon:yes stop_codon:yes gene_type:complete